MDSNDKLLDSLVESIVHSNYSVAFYRMESFLEKLNLNTLKVKIRCSIVSVTNFNTVCSLFPTLLNELENTLTSEICSVVANTREGVTPDSIEKIWSMTEQRSHNEVSANT